MRLEFAGQSGLDSTNKAMNSARLVNCFREPMTAGGFALRAVQGMAEFADLGRTFIRAMAEYRGDLLAICGGRLFRVSPAGVVSDVGQVSSEISGGIAQNTGIATIVSGGTYFTWDGADLTPVGVPDGVPVGSVSYLGGYTILTEAGGRRFWWSALADPSTIPALNFATAEITEDDLVRGVVVGDTLLLFKANGFEQWGVTTASGADAFQRISGAMVEIGLKAPDLICKFPNGAAFVGSDGKVFVWSAGTLQPISTPPVEVSLQVSRPVSVFYTALRGHGFICVAFEGCPAWCYDVALGEWHERAEVEGPWSARASVEFNGAWRVGSDMGVIATLTDVRRDFGGPLVRRAISPAIGPARPFTIARVEAESRRALDMEEAPGVERILADGVGALSVGAIRVLGEDGSDSGPASVSLRVSRDGMTFGPPKARSVGETGEYSTRLIWRALGQFRRRAVLEFSVSCPDDLPLSSAMDIEVV